MGDDLVAPARELYRVAACGETGEVPERFNRALVDAHCVTLRALYGRYRERWLNVAMPFIAALRPKDVSPRVGYPLGGGDLLSALAVFPDAEDNDPLARARGRRGAHRQHLADPPEGRALAVNDLNLRKLLGLSYSNTINLGRGSARGFPAR
jgi:hypothetical protein